MLVVGHNGVYYISFYLLKCLNFPNTAVFIIDQLEVTPIDFPCACVKMN